MPEVKTITLQLTSWQKRMLKDHMKRALLTSAKEINKIKFSVIDRRQWVMYKLPDPLALSRGAWNLYLTDQQISKVAELLPGAVQVSALRITPEMVKSKQVVFA